jgi:flagellar export protein FliJ
MAQTEPFRLQSVLNLKASMVESLEMEFARLRVAHQNEENILTSLEQALEEQSKSLRQKQGSGPIDLEEIQLRQSYLRFLDDHVAQQTVRVERSREQLETKRDELVKGMQEEQTLEKLRERHIQRQAKEVQRLEARDIDEIATTRYSREG